MKLTTLAELFTEAPPEGVWDALTAISLCKAIERVCPPFGCHVALTGGVLYKEGLRKDCDLIFYRIRQVEEINYEGLFKALEGVSVVRVSGYGWCHKAVYTKDGRGLGMDLLFPEEKGGEYDLETLPVEPGL